MRQISTTTGGGGGDLTEAAHRGLRQLIHFLDNGPADGFGSGPLFLETLPVADPFPTSLTWYEDATKARKIVELTITLNGNKTPASEVWQVYASDGSTVLATVTDTINYSGIFETSRSRAIT